MFGAGSPTTSSRAGVSPAGAAPSRRRGGEDGGDKWLELPKDLAPGEEVTLAIPRNARLYHALESIPIVDPEPLDAL